MGIATGTFQQLVQEHRQRPFTGRLLTLGRQDIYLTSEDVRFWTRYYGVEPADVPAPTLSAKPDFAVHRYIDDRTLFRYLGIEAESIDASPYEGCDRVVDLNAADPPEALRERYNVVLDAGTLEHVFHLPNAFAVCHAMLKEGGRMIHMSPATNFVDHGFYMMSPTLFQDYYDANGWMLRQIRVLRHTRDHQSATYWALDYSPDHFLPLSFGGLGEGLYQTFVVAEKTPGATASRIPQQRVYREGAWRFSPAGATTDDTVRIRVEERLGHYAKWITALHLAHHGLDVAVFGAGRHTSVLLPVWRGLQLPEPRTVCQSGAPAAGEYGGIRLMSIDELRREPPHLIVLSSRTYEMEMAETAARMFPSVPTLRFWS
jgi:hypothetical protein